MLQNARHKIFQFWECCTLGMLGIFYFFGVNLVESYKLHYKNEGNSASFKSRP
jgi:hypothetical protein